MKTAKCYVNPISDVHLLTVDETRARLGGVCRNTLRKLENAKELIPRRIDKRVFYRSSDVEVFLLGEPKFQGVGGVADYIQFFISAEGGVVGMSIGAID